MIGVILLVILVVSTPAIMVFEKWNRIKMKLYKWCNRVGYNENHKFGIVLTAYLLLSILIEFDVIDGSFLTTLVSLILLVLSIVYVAVYGFDSFVFIQRKRNDERSDANERQ